jgi:ElaB/YqjD/DUF883 family membrane-anchored ribosome-binding protein
MNTKTPNSPYASSNPGPSSYNSRTGVGDNGAPRASAANPAGTSGEDKSGADSVRDKAADAVDNVTSRVSEAASDARRTVEEGYRDAVEGAGVAYDRAADAVDRGYRQARAGAQSAAHEIDHQSRRARAEVSRYVNDHPLMVGVIGFAGGLLLGALLPLGKRSNSDNGPDWGPSQYSRDPGYRGRPDYYAERNDGRHFSG